MSQLNAFRNKVGNQNATLGQYMNAQRGLTARAGGRNDPSVIQKTLKPGQSAYNPGATAKPSTAPAKPSTAPAKPAASTTPAMPTAADRKGLAREPLLDPDPPKMTSGSMSPTPIKNQNTGMTPAILPDAPGLGFSNTYAGNPERTPVGVTTAPSTSRTIPGSTAPRSGTSDTGGFMGGKPVDPTGATKSTPPSSSSTPDEKQDLTPAKPTSSDMFDATPTSKKKMDESVIIGNYKYRIV